MRGYRAVVLAAALGAFSVLAACSGINLNRIYDIYLNVGFVIPCIYGGIFQGKYSGLCACIAGMTPYFLPNHHGFANLVPAVAIILWNVGHITIWRRGKNLPFSFLVSYLYEGLLLIALLAAGIPACHYLAGFNRLYPFGYAYSFLPFNIIQARLVFLAESLLLVFLILDTLKTLPAFKRFAHQKIYASEANNNQLFFMILLASVIAGVSSVSPGENSITYFSISINSYENSMGSLQLFLLKEILVFFVGGLMLHLLEYRCRQEAKKLEAAELQKAVFDSGSDMIWSIDGRNYEMIMTNGPASDFFQKKAGKADGNFLELLDRSEMDIWSEYIARGLEAGKYRTECYDETMKKYYSLEVSRISVDQQNYDVAFFAKDITEEVELNEQIREINNRLEDKVREKTQDLEAAYQDLNQYTHQIAHEIKAPLRAIELYNETIQDSLREGTPEEAAEASGQIGRYCRKSLNLLAETLNFSRLKAHAMKYEKIDMNELTEECIAELRNIYKEQPAECRISPLPSVEGDRSLLKSCVFNILSNSFKYSSKKERTEIEVSCQTCGSQYVFVFTDHGAGFDMDYARNLFEMFARMHTDGEFEGTGIGLALAKSVVERHGGRIWAEARPEQGCTMRFTLPVNGKENS